MRIGKILCVVYFVGLLILLVLINPGLMGSRLYLSQILEKARTPPAIQTGQGEQRFGGVVSFTYRQGLTRAGNSENELLPTRLAPSWKTEKINHGVHSASKASPAVDASGVYIGSDTGWFYKFDLSGKQVWKFRTWGARRGIHGTALLDEKFVYFGAYNGRLYCLDKAKGELQWTVQLADAVGSSPVAYGADLFVSAETGDVLSGWLYRVHRATGRVIWRSAAFEDQVHSSPTVDERRRLVYVGTNSGHLYAFDSEDGNTVWQADLQGPIKGTPSLLDDRIYISSWAKKVFAVEAGSGNIVWSTDLAGKSQTSVSVVPGENMIIAGSHRESLVYGIRALDGAIVWSREIDKEKNALGSSLVIRNEEGGQWYAWTLCKRKTLCALRTRDGSLASEIKLGGHLSGVPAVHDGKLYLALDQGSLVRFESRQ